MSRAETHAAAKAYLAEHGGSHRHALAMVMAERASNEWNAKYPIGTPVMLLTHKGATPSPTKTRSIAWALSSGSASVQVEGKSGSYGLEWVNPINVAAVPS